MVQTRKDSCLAQELVAGFCQDLIREVAVVFYFLKRTFAPFQAYVIGQVNIPHSTLANALNDAITTSQDLPRFDRKRHW
jgi:hypothetical protein